MDETLNAGANPPLALPPSAAAEAREAQFRADWVVATAFGMSLGGAVTALTVHALRNLLAPSHEPANRIGLFGCIAALGVALLGSAQARLLSRRCTRRLAIGWVAATAGGTALSCAFAPVLMLVLNLGLGHTALELGLEARLGATLLAGACFGLAVGAAQAFTLRKCVPHCRRFIAASGLGWLGATPILALGAMLCQLDRSWWEEIVFGAGAGLLAGEILGAMTAGSIRALEDQGPPCSIQRV
jgi:hypothetical protein